MIEQVIEIRAGSSGIPARIEAVQVDSGRKLKCFLTDMTIPEGAVARIYGEKPSKLEIYNDCEISGNHVIVELTTQFLAEIGTVACQVEITHDGKTVTSFDLFVDVKKKRASEGAIESTNEFTALEEALRDAKGAAYSAVSEYIDANGLVSGATEEQAEQIEKNEEDISKLSKDVNTQVTWLKGDLSQNLITKKDDILINNKVLGDTPSANTRRWFINKKIPPNSKVSSIEFYARNATVGSTITIEFWKIKDSSYILDNVVTKIPSSGGVQTVDVDYTTKAETYVSFKSSGDGVDIKTSGGTIGVLATTDITSETLETIEFIFENWDICAYIGYTTTVYNENIELKKNVVTVGEKNCDYYELQDAMDAITDDNQNNPYTIIVYPKATRYKRFSMIRKLSEKYPWEVNRVRYMSIIGIDKSRCIIQDDSGEYSTPPCEALCNGTIKNLTFISTHNSPLSTPIQGGYACHIDTKPNNGIGYDMTFENCDFVSYQAPAVGIGLHQNANLKFKDCYFENSGDVSYQPNDSYKNIAGYGGVFAHTSTIADVPNQNITFDNCRGITNYGSGLWLADAGNYNGGMTIKAIYNVFKTKESGRNDVTKSTNINVDIMSFGNNSDVLNTN